jgi:hypothetical protein
LLAEKSISLGGPGTLVQQSITFDTQVDDGLDVALAVAYAYGYDSVEELLAASAEEAEDADEEEEEAEVA